MTFKVNDRIFETSMTTGTGEYTLAGAQTGFQPFSAISANNLTTYFATDDVNWEVGIGTYVAAPSRLQRTTILASSNAGAAVNWGAGTRKIRCGLPAALAAPRTLSKSVAGGVDVTLTQDEQRRNILILTGALTANINVIVDDTPWLWTAFNNTTGAFTLTIKTAAGAGVAIPQGARSPVVCDGVNVDAAFSGGTLTGSLTGNPFFFRNRIYNGAWRFDQVNEGALYTVGASTQTVDGWTGALVGTGVFKVRRVADPDNASLFAAEITCTTADTSIAATDVYKIFHSIEGYDVADLLAGTASAKTITISFDMKFSVTGVYGISIQNSAANRRYIGTVTQNVASARESKTVTLTLDTTGTWLYTNGAGLVLTFCLAAGSNFQAAGAAWGAGAELTTSAQANFMSSVANIGYIGRIQLEKGSVATEFEERSVQQDLDRCQRYYAKTFAQGTAVAQSAGVANSLGLIVQNASANVSYPSPWRLPVSMRAAGTLITYNPSAANASFRNTTASTDFAVNVVEVGAEQIFLSALGSPAVGDVLRIHAGINARLS